VVRVPSGPQRLALRVAGLRAGQSVRLIRDGRVAAKWPREGPALAVGATVEVSAPTFFRIEVVEEGEPVVLGNPIHFVPASADATQPGRERPAP